MNRVCLYKWGLQVPSLYGLILSNFIGFNPKFYEMICEILVSKKVRPNLGIVKSQKLKISQVTFIFKNFPLTVLKILSAQIS